MPVISSYSWVVLSCQSCCASRISSSSRCLVIPLQSSADDLAICSMMLWHWEIKKGRKCIIHATDLMHSDQKSLQAQSPIPLFTAGATLAVQCMPSATSSYFSPTDLSGLPKMRTTQKKLQLSKHSCHNYPLDTSWLPSGSGESAQSSRHYSTFLGNNTGYPWVNGGFWVIRG